MDTLDIVKKNPSVMCVGYFRHWDKSIAQGEY